MQSAAPSLAGASPARGSDFKPNYFILVQVPKLSRTRAPTVLTLLCFVSTGGNLVICHMGGLNQGVGHCYGVGNGFHKLGFEILEYIQISSALHYVVCVYTLHGHRHK